MCFFFFLIKLYAQCGAWTHTLRSSIVWSHQWASQVLVVFFFFFFVTAFKIFSIALIFMSFTKIYLEMVSWFSLYLSCLRFPEVLQYVRWCSSPNLGNFQPSFKFRYSKYFFFSILFFLFLELKIHAFQTALYYRRGHWSSIQFFCNIFSLSICLMSLICLQVHWPLFLWCLVCCSKPIQCYFSFQMCFEF